MIVFDLSCGGGHVFEAWFGSQQDYDGQRARGLVSCPVCCDPEVSKAPMAPRIATGSKPSTIDPREAMRVLTAMQAKMLAGSEDVGPRFAEEARAIHAGEAEDRQIHGRATPDEARKLIEEGVPVAPLPLPVRDTSRDN